MDTFILGANGDYPEIMKEQVLMKSLQQGYNESRLPEFTSAEVARIKGKYPIILEDAFSKC